MSTVVSCLICSARTMDRRRWRDEEKRKFCSFAAELLMPHNTIDANSLYLDFLFYFSLWSHVS